MSTATVQQQTTNNQTTPKGDCPWWCAGAQPVSAFLPWCSGCNDTASKVVGTIQNTNYPQYASDTIAGSFLQPLLQALPGIGIKIGLFMGALMLVIVGFWIITSNPGGAS